ncbi:hypothetical protein ACTJI2_02190 [Pseudoxanthomonas sp. 22568]|uniref:hypothetical protein n=1 Tax=Pseudoxanthomonas sp. 22568 TaxID=3453945 RepID=UPI003F87F823
MELALLEIGPAYVEAMLSMNLLKGDEEGLGLWKAIGFSMENGAMVELVLHEASPMAGFVVRADSLHATEETLIGVLRLLGIGKKFVKWMNPQLCLPEI